MSNIITIKHGANKPSVNNLSNFELGFCTGDGHLYINNNGTIVSTKSGTATVLTGESIPSGADLDTYTTPGSYRSSSGSISETLANTPFTTTGFKLEVFNTTTANQIMQEIKCNSASSRVYRRTGNFANNVWSFTEWYKVMQSTTDALSVVSGGTGASALTSGQVLIGNGTGAVTTRAIDTTVTSNSANLITSGAVYAGLAEKQATISGGASTIASSNLTANRALVSNSSGKVAVSSVTSTELGYLDGVTSAIQTQLNGKLSTSGGEITGMITTSETGRTKGYYLTDKSGASYPAMIDNGTNLWIGATQISATHHVGATYISTGYNTTDSKGNETIYLVVPNADNTDGSSRKVIHSGNYDDYALPLSGGNLTGNVILNNGKGYQQKDTEGDAYSLIFLSTSNTLQVGYGMPAEYPLKINNKMVLTSNNYGTSLPAAGTKGRIFFKKA